MAELSWVSSSQAPWEYYIYQMVRGPNGSYKVRVLQVGVSFEQAESDHSTTSSYSTFTHLVHQHSQGMIAPSDLTYSILQKVRGKSDEDLLQIWGEGLSLENALSRSKKYDLAVIDDVTLKRFRADGLIIG